MGENPEKKKRGVRRMIGLAFSFFSFAVLTYIAVMMISGRQSELLQIIGVFSDRTPVEMAGEYHFDVGRSRVFAHLDNSLVAAGTLGIQVLDPGGNVTLSDSFRMSEPAIYPQDELAIVFDIGGTAVRVFSKTEVVVSFETGGVIVSASINRNGWISVCTQESGASKGVVTVYDSSGSVVYRVNLATGYVLSAMLAPDNRSVAILNLTDIGSRITFYNLNSVEVARVFDLPDRLILDMRYLAGGALLAISTDSLFVVDRNGIAEELYEFGGRRPGSFALDGGFISLYLLDHSIGHMGRLVTLDEAGGILGEVETDREIIFLSSGDGYLAALRNDGIVFFNTELEELPASGESASAAGATRVLVLDNGFALAAGDHSAVIFRVES